VAFAGGASGHRFHDKSRVGSEVMVSFIEGEQTLAQFLKSKWQRYHDPVWDALLTGRSSLLNEKGEIAPSLLTIDPAYKIPPIDWPVVAKKGATWPWLGDGVLADLTIKNLGGTGPRGPTPAYPTIV
jgi:hypothetical protein